MKKLAQLTFVTSLVLSQTAFAKVSTPVEAAFTISNEQIVASAATYLTENKVEIFSTQPTITLAMTSLNAQPSQAVSLEEETDTLTSADAE
ncbi:hypothetical protein ACFSJY_19120 [Thalassotalea euphylliae]|uniref:hypothetical protein n=1 Tax=Thalassotalea euphylliae TaxID=1655234 RepID=UPI00362C446D